MFRLAFFPRAAAKSTAVRPFLRSHFANYPVDWSAPSSGVCTYTSARFASIRNSGDLDEPTPKADITGSSTLISPKDALHEEASAIVASSGNGNRIETTILTFNAIRRLHMAEAKPERKRQLEAQAWRTIQSLQQGDIDAASDYGVTLVVCSWSYFSKFWENGRRGPEGVDTAATGDQSAATGNNSLYPPEKDFAITLDHSSALIHDIDNLIPIDSKDGVDDVEGDDEAIASDDGDTLDERLAGASDHADDTDSDGPGTKTTPALPPVRQKRHPLQQRSTTEGGNNSRTLRRPKPVAPQSEVVEAPRAEVLDEVFE